jgi:hypothetical protein
MDQPGQRTISEQEFSQLQENYRKTLEQLNQMKGTLDTVMVTRNQPAAPPTLPKTRLTPEAQEDVVKLAQHLFQQQAVQQNETTRQAFNSLWERTDLAEFRATRGVDTYDKYKDKIESLRQDKMRQGQFITRDEAYKFVHFDETGKKPRDNVSAAPTEPPKPVWDPYLQQYTLPKQDAPVQAVAPQVAQPPNQQQVAPPAQPQVTPPNPTVTMDGVQDFNLPPQGPMRSSVATPPAASQGPINLEVNSNPQTLEAFEAKYGDVPL